MNDRFARSDQQEQIIGCAEDSHGRKILPERASHPAKLLPDMHGCQLQWLTTRSVAPAKRSLIFSGFDLIEHLAQRGSAGTTPEAAS